MRDNYRRKAAKFGRMADVLFEELYGDNRTPCDDDNAMDLRGALATAMQYLRKAVRQSECLAIQSKEEKQS